MPEGMRRERRVCGSFAARVVVADIFDNLAEIWWVEHRGGNGEGEDDGGE